MRVGLAILVSVTAVACGGGTPEDCTIDRASTSRDDGWAADVRCIRAILETKHPDAFASAPQAAFESSASAIAREIPALTDPQAASRLMALVAILRDGHTYVYSATTWTQLAVGFRRFPEGIFVVAAVPELEAWLGSRVTSIGGVPIEEVRARVAALIPQETGQTVASREAGLLENVDVLQGIGAADPAKPETDLLLETSGGSRSIRVGRRNDLPVSFPAALPRSLAHVDVPYWFDIEAATRTLYVQYNACRERKDLPMAQFAADVQRVLEAGDVDRAVLDVRWNGGGSSNVNEPLEKAFRAWQGSADPARFSILIGPKTFSSGVWAAFFLRARTNARVLGEAAGGDPNGFGNVEVQTLPWSRLRLQFSTKAFRITDETTNRLEPDQVIPWSWADYVNGIDPVLVAAGMSGR